MHTYNITFTAGGRSYSFSTTISLPRDYRDQNLVRTAVMSAIGRYKRANGITDTTTCVDY